MFIGREKELEELKITYDLSEFSSILIYGRRRVGKTELIRESLKDIKEPIISFECKKTSIKENVAMLSKVLAKTLDKNGLGFANFLDLLEYIFKESLKQKMYLIIDEFSFLLDEDASIESDVALMIDKYKNASKLKLILSGSYVSLMLKMIEYGSHSYGRFTNVFFIRPFDYFEVSEFYKNYSSEDKILMYSVFGGLPYFNSLINPNLSAKDNIINLIVKKDSIIEQEIIQMILLETNKISYLNEVISLLARGFNKYKDIVVNLGNTKRPEYLLNKLVELNIIRKVVPINDKSNKKATFYEFEDNTIDFYYRYIFNNPYSINRTNAKFFYDNFIEEDLKISYIPKKFENISASFLLKQNLAGHIKPILMDIGTYFFNDKKNKINRQFDVVTKDELGYISYECKYKNHKISSAIIEEEEKQIRELNIKFYKLGFISKSGFTADVDKDKYICYNLDDFYKYEGGI